MSHLIPQTKHTTIGRLAPSPTGNLHLGNAWSFLIAWLACRLENGKLFLRMEDIDTQRSKKEYAHSIIKDLSWLGIDWDETIIWQSERDALYESTIQYLSPWVYKCYCTRKELRDLAGAPQQNNGQNSRQNEGQNDGQNNDYSDCLNSTKAPPRFVMPDAGAPYSGKCRNLTPQAQEEKEQSTKNFCLRLACPPFDTLEKKYVNNMPDQNNPKTQHFHVSDTSYPENNSASLTEQQENSPINQANYRFNDLVLGEQVFSLTDCGGDFALRRSDGVWAYQLAVSCDDINMGINQIVRGDDILSSTPRQLYIYSRLNACGHKYPEPRFAHIPLLLDENNERLAKRHASMSLTYMREQNNSPTTIINYLASLMGINGNFKNAKELLQCMQNAKFTQFPWKNLNQYKNEHGIITNTSQINNK